jgi:hypothetical protein
MAHLPRNGAEPARKRTRGGVDTEPPPPPPSDENQKKPKKKPAAGKKKKKKERNMDPVRVHLPSTHDQHAVFHHGNFQVPKNSMVEPPPAIHAPPPREFQNGQTLMPPMVRPMASLLGETNSYMDQPPLDVLRSLYSLKTFEQAVQIRAAGHRNMVPPEVMAAVDHLAGSPGRVAPMRNGNVSHGDEGEEEEEEIDMMVIEEEEGRVIVSQQHVELREEHLDPDGRQARMPPMIDKAKQVKTKPSARPVRIMDLRMGTLLPPKQDSNNNNNTTKTDTNDAVTPGFLARMQASTTTPVDNNNNKQNQEARRLFHLRRHRNLLLYYKTDPEPDPDLPFGLTPNSYPMFNSFMRELKPLWQQRVAHGNEAAEHMPRAQVERHDQKRRQWYRRHYNPLTELPCENKSQCIVCVLANQEGQSKWAYALPKFLTFDEETEHNARRAAAVPVSQDKPGPCIECIDYRITQQVLYNNLATGAPQEFLNKYSVHVGVGGYAREGMIPEKIDGVKTPIAGHVPIWDAGHRQFDPLPGGTAEQMLLREVNMDFRPSLSQTNACLGARKSRPLAGNNGGATATLPHEFIADDPVTLAHAHHLPQAWLQFLSTAPTAVLSDRALILPPSARAARGCGVGIRESMVPAVWLRLFLHLDDSSSPDATQHHMETLVKERISPSIVSDLLIILSPHPPPDGPQKESSNDRQRCQTLASLLVDIGRATFTTFERSFAQLEVLEPLLDCLLQHAVRESHVKNVRYPWLHETIISEFRGFHKNLPPTASKARVWRTAMARIMATLLFQMVIRPWPAYQAATFGAAFAKHARYFMDTHLSVLVTTSYIATNPAPGMSQLMEELDHWWLTPATPQGDSRLAFWYPNCTRVVCAEELPDLMGMMFATNFWYDLPSKKTHTSLLFALIHILSKVLNNVCQRRGFNTIIVSMMRTYPVIRNMICLIMEASLLGNMPHAESRLPLAARMRIHATFTWTTNNGESERNSDKERYERVYAWIMTHPLITMNLLREYMFYCIESNGPIDMLRGLSGNWQRYKAISRQLQGQIRRHVAHQVALHGLRGKIEWDELERVKGQTTVGEVLRWHEKQKAYNVKLRKDTILALLLKKARSMEKKFVITQDDIDWMKKDGKLEALHVFCWQAALERHMTRDDDGYIRSMIKTGFFKLFGMDEQSWWEFREWLHLSDEYVFPDDGIKKLFGRMYRRSPRSYMVFKNAWFLIDFYSNDLLFFRPIDEMRFSLISARFNILVPKDVATQPRLGYGYYCDGCMKWGNTPVEISAELVGMAPAHVSAPKKKRRRPVVTPTPPPPPLVVVSTTPLGNNSGLNKKKREKPPRPWAARACYVADGRAPCVNKLYFNMVNAKLYCKSANFAAEAVAAYKAKQQALIAPERPAFELTEDEEGDEEKDKDSEDESEEEEEEEKANGQSGVVRGRFDLLLDDEPLCNHPVIPVDLLGVYRWLCDSLYGLCVYCSRFSEVLAVNMTNRGLSCGEHAFPDEYPKNHPLWKHIHRPKDPALPNAARDIPCIMCQMCDENAQLIDVYDYYGTFFQVALCGADLQFSRGLVMRGRYNIMPPISLKLLLTTIAMTRRG